MHLKLEGGWIPGAFNFFTGTYQEVWRALSSLQINKKKYARKLQHIHILFGVFYNSEDFLILNRLVIMGKFFLPIIVNLIKIIHQ